MQYDRTEAYVAAVVDVDVRPDTGTVRVRRVCVAHDCGLIVNPDGLRNQIEGNVIQAISRTLKEAVRFDATRVTGVDWNGYPILRFSEIPDAIDIELIDRPDQPSVGAGEAATSPIPRGDRERDLRRDGCARTSGPVHAGPGPGPRCGRRRFDGALTRA